MGTPADVASQSLSEAAWIITVAPGADLVWDTLSAGKLQRTLFVNPQQKKVVAAFPGGVS